MRPADGMSVTSKRRTKQWKNRPGRAHRLPRRPPRPNGHRRNLPPTRPFRCRRLSILQNLTSRPPTANPDFRQIARKECAAAGLWCGGRFGTVPARNLVFSMVARRRFIIRRRASSCDGGACVRARILLHSPGGGGRLRSHLPSSRFFSPVSKRITVRLASGSAYRGRLPTSTQQNGLPGRRSASAASRGRAAAKKCNSNLPCS